MQKNSVSDQEQKDTVVHSVEELAALRHSFAHLFAAAVMELFPGTKLAIGPSIENGFYYDALYERALTEEDLALIEKKMRHIAPSWGGFERKEYTPAEAKKMFAHNKYKLELIEEHSGLGEKITTYTSGTFTDLCRGGHVEKPGKVLKYFKLLSIAGAYWRGDEKNEMLTRVYGTAFFTQEELTAHLAHLEDTKRRDHRKLGQELDFFSTNPLTGQGLILWHPKLAQARTIVEDYWRKEHYKRGYQLVFTPHIASMDMFVKSRHLSKYVNSMFPVMQHELIEGESSSDYQTDEILKPMNCPNHIQVFKAHPRSYRELPMRIGELGTVYRYERAGVLHGLTRVRGFTQDDSHIFCTPDQVMGEVRGVLQLMKEVYALFGFKDYQAYISTRPEKYLGSSEIWQSAEESLKDAAVAEGFDNYKIDEGGGAFYGPKIDIKVKDSLGREWQLGTVQFDFNQPDLAESTEQDIDEFWALKTFKAKFKTRANVAKYLKKMGRGFDVNYVDSDGKEKRCVMVHRVVFGSMERFFGILIEHFAGAFPLWMAPVQVAIVPISEDQAGYAQEVQATLEGAGLRVELMAEAESMQNRIRKAEGSKIPYIIVVGKKEAADGTLSVRRRGRHDDGVWVISNWIEKVKKEVAERVLGP